MPAQEITIPGATSLMTIATKWRLVLAEMGRWRYAHPVPRASGDKIVLDIEAAPALTLLRITEVYKNRCHAKCPMVLSTQGVKR
jgi:hypothetical protein